MILLDTNAVIWLLAGDRRSAPLQRPGARLYFSPVVLLELKFLLEVGRLTLASGGSLSSIAHDPRWQLDSPASDVLFNAAVQVDWTRDPFDRLIVAHAQCRRWRLATGDRLLLARLPAAGVVGL